MFHWITRYNWRYCIALNCYCTPYIRPCWKLPWLPTIFAVSESSKTQSYDRFKSSHFQPVLRKPRAMIGSSWSHFEPLLGMGNQNLVKNGLRVCVVEVKKKRDNMCFFKNMHVINQKLFMWRLSLLECVAGMKVSDWDVELWKWLYFSLRNIYWQVITRSVHTWHTTHQHIFHCTTWPASNRRRDPPSCITSTMHMRLGCSVCLAWRGNHYHGIPQSGSKLILLFCWFQLSFKTDQLQKSPGGFLGLLCSTAHFAVCLTSCRQIENPVR